MISEIITNHVVLAVKNSPVQNTINNFKTRETVKFKNNEIGFEMDYLISSSGFAVAISDRT